MKINSIQEYDGKYLKVVEDGGCDGCFFIDEDDECFATGSYAKCYPSMRGDDKFVKYIEVMVPKVGEEYEFNGVVLKFVEFEGKCSSCYFSDQGNCRAAGFYENCDGGFFILARKEGVQKEYESLNKVLQDAYAQAATGKGVERHAADNNFEDQVICVVQRLLFKHPFGYQAGQAIKKLIEAGRLYDLERPDEAYAEVCGAINYAAAMAHLIKENNGGN
jgi:hypothetical protein